MNISSFNLSRIYVRADGSYLVDKGTYHVPNEGEWKDLWVQVDAYAKEHPEAVCAEPTPPEPTPAEFAAHALEQAKAERAAAVAAITVTVDGMVFDGDEKAQERMARAVLMAESPEEQTEWVLHDNTVALVTADQLKRACRAAGKAQTALWTVPYEA